MSFSDEETQKNCPRSQSTDWSLGSLGSFHQQLSPHPPLSFTGSALSAPVSSPRTQALATRQVQEPRGGSRGATFSLPPPHRSRSRAPGPSRPAAVTTPQQAARPIQTAVWRWRGTQRAARRTCPAWTRGLALQELGCLPFAALRTSGWTSYISSGRWGPGA